MCDVILVRNISCSLQTLPTRLTAECKQTNSFCVQLGGRLVLMKVMCVMWFKKSYHATDRTDLQRHLYVRLTVKPVHILPCVIVSGNTPRLTCDSHTLTVNSELSFTLNSFGHGCARVLTTRKTSWKTATSCAHTKQKPQIVRLLISSGRFLCSLISWLVTVQLGGRLVLMKVSVLPVVHLTTVGKWLKNVSLMIYWSWKLESVSKHLPFAVKWKLSAYRRNLQNVFNDGKQTGFLYNLWTLHNKEQEWNSRLLRCRW